MTTQVASLEKTVRAIPARPIAAFLVWSGAVWTTGEAIKVLEPGLGAIHLYLMAMATQAIMTYLESDIWAGRFRLLSLVVLLVDILVNAGGIWPWILKIDETPVWAMLVEAGIAPAQMSIIAAISISLVAGTILAATPEQIWSAK